MSETIPPIGRTTGASEWLVFFTNLSSTTIRERALQELAPNEALSILSWLPNGESFRMNPETVFFYDRSGTRLLRSAPRWLSVLSDKELTGLIVGSALKGDRTWRTRMS